MVELLIIISVLSLIAVGLLIILNPGKQQRTARDAIIKSDIAQITLGLQSYYTINRIYPATLDLLKSNDDLKTVPVPKGGGQYNYSLSSGCDVVSCEAVVYYLLNQPQTSGNVWCWKSSQGRATETALSDCTPS